MHMEIEADTENDLIKFLTDLNIDKNNIRYSGASMFYNEILGVDLDKINNNTPVLDFKSVKTELRNSINNKEKFNEILQEQIKQLRRFGFENLIGGKKLSKKQSKKLSKIKKNFLSFNCLCRLKSTRQLTPL